MLALQSIILFLHATEVEIEIIDSEDVWAPYISLDDVLKLDRVKETLKSVDVAAFTVLPFVHSSYSLISTSSFHEIP